MTAGAPTRFPASRNETVLRTLEPFLVTAAWHCDCFDRAPFGITIAEPNVFDATRMASSTFLDRLIVLDRLTFGPEGMPMPGWVFYNGAEVPGGIFGFACRADALPPEVHERLELEPGATGLMPLSMWIAIPVRPPHTWFGHNLASLNPVVPELNLKGLASITKAMAIKVFGCRSQIGATQWDSEALHIHTRFGPLELVTAWTPAHSEPATFTYRIDVTDLKLRNAMGDPDVTLPRVEAEFTVPIHDATAMQRLQARIESGERFVITGPPRSDGEGPAAVPLATA